MAQSTGGMAVLLVLYALFTSTTAAHSQLTVLTLPEALVSSSGNVVEGSVIQIYCTVEGDTTVTFSWTLNGTTLLNDPPHIRIREDNHLERSASLLTDDSSSVLTVDNFRASDNGVYQCTATNGSSTSGNGAAVKLTAVTSTVDGTLDVILQPSDLEPVDQLALFNDNRTGVALGGTIDGSVMTCTAGHQGDRLMNYSLPSVVWVRNGQAVDDTDSRITITSTTMANGRLTSSLTITNFAAGDAGVYQCVFTDDSDGGDTKIITSIPYQLDTGNIIGIERVSPEVIILHPPEKLIIEVRASGEYQVLYWTKDGNKLSPLNVTPQEYPNFHEIFVRGSTTLADEGIYTVQPQFKPGTQQTHLFSPIGGVTFGVFSPVDASTTALSGPVVVIPEEGSQDILCKSTGAPVPSITWQLNNQTSEFEQTDVVNQFDAPLINTDTGTIAQLTPGNIESTLRIVSARYPDHDGVYTCVGTNTDDLTVASSTASIMVQINVVPEVEITATRTLVGVGEDVTLSCVILRGNPANYHTTITHTDTDNSFPGPTLNLTGFQATDNGTYSCEVTNDAGTGSANVTIELGDPPVVTTLQPDPVIMNSAVELVCIVTGDTPIDIVWERLYTNGSVQVVYAGNDTTGGNFSLTATLDSFGMYRCNATSHFGMDSSSIDITQAVPPLVVPLSADQREFASEGESVTLSFRIDNASPPVMASKTRWFYSASNNMLEITDLTNRTASSILTFSNDRLTLTIESIVQAQTTGEETDQGRYTLQATNEAGVSSSYIDLLVTGPPVITEPPINQFFINNGSDAVFSCVALAIPQHNVSWSFNGTTLDISDSTKYSVVGDNSSARFGELTIISVDYEDRGVYTCLAANSIGSVIVSANLTVHVVPEIRDISTLTEVRLGRPAVLACLTIGFPTPSISWRKDGEQVSIYSDSSLSTRLDIIEFSALIMDTNTTDFESSGYTGSGTIMGLLMMYTEVTVDEVRQLGGLGVVGLLSFEETVRGDTADYTCVASNSLPETTTLVIVSDNIPLVVLDFETDSILIQLRLTGIGRCQSWVEIDARQKLDAVNISLVNNIEERCQCGFTILGIAEPRFRCFVDSESAVTYRAHITGTDRASSLEVTQHIEEWVEQGAAIEFEFAIIPVDSGCPVVITSILDPECNNVIATPILPLVGGVTVASVLLMIIAIVSVITIILIIWYRKKQKGSFDITTNRPTIELGEVTENPNHEYEDLDLYKEQPPKEGAYEEVVFSPTEQNQLASGDVNFDIRENAAYAVTSRQPVTTHQ